MRGWISSPWLPLVVAFLLIALAAYFAVSGDVPQWIEVYNSQPRGLTELLIALAGWLLALTGLLFAGKDAKRALAFDALAKLFDDEEDEEQAEAKRLIWQAAPPEGYSGNLYSYIREHLKELSPEQRHRLDKARRRLTHFWYRAARLVDLGILDSSQLFKSIGPPDILMILEPLEAIQAESIDPDWRPKSWPPMNLLITWYRQQGHRQKVRQLPPEVPSQPDLYDRAAQPAPRPTRLRLGQIATLRVAKVVLGMNAQQQTDLAGELCVRPIRTHQCHQ